MTNANVFKPIEMVPGVCYAAYHIMLVNSTFKEIYLDQWLSLRQVSSYDVGVIFTEKPHWQLNSCASSTLAMQFEQGLGSLMTP